MTEPHPWYEKYLAPYPLLLGVAVSFLACCGAGWRTSGQNLFPAFERFHPFINIDSLFYPTASQVHSLAKARLDPDKIVVVIGGSSILYGAGQHPDEDWASQLQVLLGDRYQVINFGMPGAHLIEFGATAAEILSRDYPRMIFLTDPGAACVCPDPDGFHRYQYFFWDAFYKGLLTNDPAREERLTELAIDRGDNDKFAELQMQMRLDSGCYFRDLWTTLAYRRFATMWAPAVSKSFTKARRRYGSPDATFSLPLDKRYPAALNEYTMKYVRGCIELGRKHTLAPIAPNPKRGGQGSETQYATHLERSVKLGFPEPFRQRTLMTLVHQSPYYLDQLASHERADFDALYPAAAQVLQQAGFASVQAGKDYPASAFFDHGHLSDEGATRLANEVAPAIRALATKLGYVNKGETP